MLRRIAFLAVVGVVLAAPAAAAAEVPLSVGHVSAPTSVAVGSVYEPSSTQATQDFLTCVNPESASVIATVRLDIEGVPAEAFRATVPAKASVGGVGAWAFLLSAGSKFEVSGSGLECAYRQSLVKGGEGPAGKEGAAGKEGPEGKAGVEGKSGGAYLTSFQGEAGSQIDGDTEAVTNAIWYLIGAIIACVAVLLLYKEIRQRG